MRSTGHGWRGWEGRTAPIRVRPARWPSAAAAPKPAGLDQPDADPSQFAQEEAPSVISPR